jgi:hypothetical protein
MYKYYDIKTMSLQEIFDTVCKHLAEQGVQSKEHGAGYCSYFGPHDRQCSVGIFLNPDAAAQYEGKGVWAIGKEEFGGCDNTSLLARLQRAHDQRSDVHTLRDRLAEIAGDNNFSYDAVDLITSWKLVDELDEEEA